MHIHRAMHVGRLLDPKIVGTDTTPESSGRSESEAAHHIFIGCWHCNKRFGKDLISAQYMMVGHTPLQACMLCLLVGFHGSALLHV